MTIFKPKANTGEELLSLEKKYEEMQRKLNDLEKKLNAMETKFAPTEAKLVSKITGFGGEEEYEKMKNICEDISLKDESFRFRGNKESMEIFLESGDRDSLHKKSMWLIKKTGIKNLRYEVRKSTAC
jgi:hypothetical protein